MPLWSGGNEAEVRKRLAAGADPCLLLGHDTAMHIAAEHSSPAAVGVMAAACHVSRRQLFRILAEHGTTFADELRRLRVENARRVLVTDARRTVSSIATACGFTTPSHFYRTFKAATGMTPAEYRLAVASGVARPGTDVARDAMP